jgi:hypothetical protein
LFLNDEEKCIDSYARAVQTILNQKYLSSRATIDAEIALIGKMRAKSSELAEEVKLYLNIAMYLISEESSRNRYRGSLQQYRVTDKTFKKPVVIIAGGAARMDESKVNDYNSYIQEVMLGFRGTIISGGTTSGIPGLVGKVKGEMSKNNPVEFDLESYLPEKLPTDAERSDYYDKHHKTPSKNFCALDVFVCWTDLICNGIDPGEIILIGIEGGRISTMEYKIALSLGAKVALVAYSGRAASEFVQDKSWKNHPNLLILPNDPLTLWALVNQTVRTQLTDDDIRTLAPKVHDFYRDEELKKFKSNSEDINKYKVLMPWDNLSEALRNSNIEQVAFYELILKRVGLNIRKAEKPLLFDMEAELSGMGKDEKGHSPYDILAMLEHARWNAERLLDGWRYGPKNITKKLNPCLVPWTLLDDSTKNYDYKPVKNIPRLLAMIGYEVYEDGQEAK